MTHSTANVSLEASRNADSSPRLTPCPPELEDLLDVFAMLPPDCELPDLATKFAPYAMRPITSLGEPGDGSDGVAASLQALKDYEDRNCGIDRAIEAYRVFGDHIKELPRSFRFHLWHSEPRNLSGLRDDPDYASEEDQEGLNFNIRALKEIIENCKLVEGDIEESAARIREELIFYADETNGELAFDDEFWELLRGAVREYTYVRESRLKLLKLIRRAALRTQDDAVVLSRHELRVGDLDTASVRGFLRVLDPIYSDSTIEIDESGIARLYSDPFTVAIDGVDVNRIRECKICQRIFWAGRKDSWCCSTGCADKRRKRQHRARYKERLAGPPTTAKTAPKLKQPLGKSGRL